MDINFDSFRKDLDKFEKVWKKAYKEQDVPMQATILNAFANNLQTSQVAVRKQADSVSAFAVSQVATEINKA